MSNIKSRHNHHFSIQDWQNLLTQTHNIPLPVPSRLTVVINQCIWYSACTLLLNYTWWNPNILLQDGTNNELWNSRIICPAILPPCPGIIRLIGNGVCVWEWRKDGSLSFPTKSECNVVSLTPLFSTDIFNATNTYNVRVILVKLFTLDEKV